MEIKKIGVVGAGQMGSGIAEVGIVSGFNITMRDVNEEAVQRGKNRIVSDLERQVKKQKITADEKEKVLTRLSTTTRLEDLKDCDFLIEAATEHVALQGEIFKTLDEITRKEAILASNTSSTSITRIASFTKRPERVVGIHFLTQHPAIRLIGEGRGY